MKVKQRTTCQSCRKGKISCDGKRPACSQCLFRGLDCPGYSVDWVFVPQTTHHGRKAKARRTVVQRQTGGGLQPQPNESQADLSAQLATPSTELSLRELITTIIDNYVPELDAATLSSSVEPSPRICGSWVEVLPELIGYDTDKALASAVRAFAVCILSRGPKRSFPVPEGLEAYNQALISVNEALRSPYSDFPVAIAAAVMCLLLAELYHVTSLCSYTAHLQGLADLMQLSRPEVYASGIPHRLFVGARPALVVLAFLSRKSSFLAMDEWRNIPFRETAPSPVQTLMSEAAAIPAILERMDAKGASPVAEESLQAFEKVLNRLDTWATNFHSSVSASSPLFWFQPSADGGRQHIWFRNITVASALTHLWSFRVVCLTNIDRLRAVCEPEAVNTSTMAHFDETKRLSVMICQSIGYLMQDKMKLFGPTSVSLPLRTAYETFEAGGDQSADELSWCKEILTDIRSRGYEFVSFLGG